MRSFRRRSAYSRTKLAASQGGPPPVKARPRWRARYFEHLEPRLFLANQPLITEFVASNGSLVDGRGLTPDWIEIHNPTSQAINLANWHLTDQADNLDKWTFPAAAQSMLDPGEYLIVFASGQDVETFIDPAGYLHTDFELSGDGEYLALTDANDVIIHEFAPEYPRQVHNVSYGLLPNTSTITLFDNSDPTSAFVPTNSSLDAPSVNVAPSWTLPGFSDASWSHTIAGTGVGFDFGDDAPPGTANGTILPGGLIGSDLTDADQNGALDGTIFEGGPPNWPNGEEPPRGLDSTISTKWLAFSATGAPYGFRFAGGLRHAVNAYTITSANDAPNRDPYAWTLSGSNNGVNYTQIDSRTAQIFTDRHQTRLYEFTNSTSYEYYRFDFKTKFGVTLNEADRPNANAIQMAEIELFARGPVDFAPHIDLNVQSAYSGPKTSVYQRVEFGLTDPSTILSLSLDLEYDDGIIVYLNGKRVAAANAPSASTLPTFQTNATGQRNNSAALVPQTFDLTPHLNQLVAGTNVLAIHVLNINDASEDLLSKPRLTARRLNDETLIPVYMADPTPGALNISGYTGLVEPPQFSVDHGFFNAPFQLTITTPTPNAQIYYTTDGSAPSSTNGTLYTGPITIDRTRTIRADAFRDGWLSADSVTNTYIFINEIVRQNYQAVINAGFPATWGGTAADYGLDPDVIGNFNATGNPIGGDLYGGIYAATIKNDLLAIPTMSIVMDMDDIFGPNGIYSNPTFEGVGSERATSIELINPDGSTGFQIEAGIEIHGGAFKSHGLSRKHSFRLSFKGEYEGNTELEFPLFGPGATDSFDTIVLRMDSNDGYAWSSAGAAAQYARDEWGRRSQAALGQHAIHGTRVHLYINGVYWGIYNPTERADATFSASYYGGEKHEWDATNSGDPVDGNMTAWNTLVSLSQAVSSAPTEAQRTAAYMRVRGLNPDGTDNPSFEAYLDAVNYVDYLMVNFYGANVDWPHRNWYTSRLRGPDSQGFVFHNWDFETALDLAGSSVNTNNTNAGNGAAQPYSHLHASQEFRVLFGDRVHRAFFNNGPLTTTNSVARYQEVVNELQQIIVAESARWGDMHRSTPYTKADWQGQIPVVNNFLNQRNSIFLNQLRSAGLYPSIVAPTFSQHGGQVPSGFGLTMSAPAGAIWYTTDGSDPRALGGGISPTAHQYTGTPINITGGTTVKARALSGGQWSALNEADFGTDVGNLRITEINYNPDAFPGVVDEQDIEFFEVLNTGGQSVSLNGVQIGGFSNTPYTFASGLTLAAGQRIIVARDRAVFQSVYGPGLNVAPNGFEPDNLSNSGELVTLLGPLGEVIQSFTYGSTSPWPTEPDGLGRSLEIVNPLGDAASAANWRASFYTGGSPGASGVLGDYDGNNLVDDADYQTWRSSYDLVVPRGIGADGNRNGIVETADFVIWRKAVSTAPAAAQAAAATRTSADNASSQSSSLPISPARTISNPAGETASQPTGAPTTDLRFKPTARAILSSGQSAATLQESKPSVDPARDLALLLALRSGMSTSADPEYAVEPDRGDIVSDDSIEWIDDAFASLTLL